MSHEPSIAIPQFIDVTDVMRSMKCSRSRAYAHMRAALGRQAGERGQSRVPLYVWERYVRKRFDPESRDVASNGLTATAHPILRITRPRTKLRQPISESQSAPLQSPRVNDEPPTC